MTNRRLFWAFIFGNLLDHYDTALYGLLAPILAPLFFPNLSTIPSLIFTYLLMSVSLFTKPLGSLFFGKYTLKSGPKEAMMLSLFGLALSTGLMGILPTASKTGLLAPFCLAICRLIQGFFAAGEKSIGNLYLVEQAPKRDRGKASSAFNTSEIGGILLASFIATLVTRSSSPHTLWRLPFLAGSFTALIGIFVRNYLPDTPLLTTISHQKYPLIKTLKRNKSALLRIIFASSFTYLTYSIPFVFFNSFIPLITDISLSSMLQYNTLFLLLDLLLLPLFGRISDRFNPLKWMATSALFLAASALPLFFLLPHANILTIFLVRLWIVLTGLAFLPPLQGWFLSLLSREECYLLSGFAFSLGAEIFGKTTPAICLFLWFQFKTTAAPALYIIFIALCTGISVLTSQKHLSTQDDLK